MGQIALVHLLFNLTGIILFYPVPVMRWPISIARVLGNTTAQYRWFAVVYLCFMFFIFPLTMFGLSMCGSMVVITSTVLLVTLLAFSVTMTKMQTACPNYLPALLRSWAFLPLSLHSLDPWDRVIVGALGCCCSKRDQPAGDDLEQVIIHKKSANNGGAAPLRTSPRSSTRTCRTRRFSRRRAGPAPQPPSRSPPFQGPQGNGPRTPSPTRPPRLPTSATIGWPSSTGARVRHLARVPGKRPPRQAADRSSSRDCGDDRAFTLIVFPRHPVQRGGAGCDPYI